MHDDENPYPYIPIAIEDNGYGVNHLMADIHEKYVGISQHLQSTLIAEARQLTTWENVTEITGSPPVITRNIDPTRQIYVSPKETIPLAGAEDDPNRESMEFMQWPALPIEVIQLAGRTNQMVDEATKMDRLSGETQPGVETATEATQNVRNASAKLGGPVSGMERIATKLSKWALMDVDMVIESQVTLFGTGADEDKEGESTLGPKDIDGFYKLSVGLTTSDEDAVALNNARFWMEAYRVIPFLSAFTVMEKGDISDQPMLEIVQRAAEDVFLSDENRMVRNLTGAQSYGEFVEMFKVIIEAGSGGGGGGAASNAGLFAGGAEGATEDIVANSLNDRETSQGEARLRA